MPFRPRFLQGSARLETALQGALVLAGLGLVLVPLALLAVAPPPALGRPSPVSPWSALSDPHLRGLLWRTLRLAGWVTAATLAVGVPLGLWLAHRRGPLTALLALLHALPLALPPYLTALGWAHLLGVEGPLAPVLGPGILRAASAWLYGEPGVVLALTGALGPLVTLLTAAFARNIDPARREAGLLARGPTATLIHVELPLVAPGVAAGALLVFLLSAGEVAVPQLLRVPVYASVVFSRMADLSFQPGEALALSVPTTLLALAAALALARLDRLGKESRGLRAAPPTLPSPGIGRRAAGAVAVAVCLAGLAPVAWLLVNALWAPGGGLGAMRQAAPALENSLRVSAWSATAMTAAALGFAWLWSRRPRRTAWLSLPLLLGLLLPSAVLALALTGAWNRSATQWIYRSDGILMLALAARYLYVPLRVAKLGRDPIRASWLEAARLLPRSWIARIGRVDLPLLRDAALLTWAAAFGLCLRDLETTIPFYPPGGETLPIRTMTLEANAPVGAVAATASLQVLVTVILLALGSAALARARRSPDVQLFPGRRPPRGGTPRGGTPR